MLHIDRTTYRSPNHDARPHGRPISALVLHSTEGAWPSDARWLCDPGSKVSAHYVIAPDGDIFQLVDDSRRAWHAGRTQYGALTDWNDFSIGIELSYRRGAGGYPEVQRAALTALCRHLLAAYAIAPALVVAHRWIAIPRGRKSDPTDWPDAALRAWIDTLGAPQSRDARPLDARVADLERRVADLERRIAGEGDA